MYMISKCDCRPRARTRQAAGCTPLAWMIVLEPNALIGYGQECAMFLRERIICVWVCVRHIVVTVA